MRTELLAKVRDVPFSGVDRNIFEFTQRRAKVAPPPPAMANAAQKRQEEFEARAKARANAARAKPSAPRAPKLTWKYYGFASEAAVGKRRAFLLDLTEYVGLFHKHIHFGIQKTPGFYGIYGFVGCVFLVLAAKELRKLVMRSEDYYDR